MKVLLIHDYGSATGGAENQMLRLRTLLRNRGHEVRLFSSRASLISAPIEADDTCFGSTTHLQLLTQTVNPSAYLNLRRVLNSFRPDVVHVRMFLWQLSPAILPLLRNVPALYQTATYKSVCPTGKKILPDGTICKHQAGFVCRTTGCLTNQSWAVLMLQRQLWLKWRHVFDAVVALSETMKKRLEENGLQPVEVIYNGVPESPASPALTDVPVIAYAGRLSPEKGLFVLLDALSRLQRKNLPFRFVVAGEGPLRARILARLDELGLRAKTDFFGYLPRAEMERAFNGAWVQAIPSLWDEPFGNVATEAMMRGTAVVASATGGLLEIVEHGVSGFHVPPGQPEALAQTLESLIQNRGLAMTMGRAGRCRALERFSEDACLNAFLALYERLRNQTAYGKPRQQPAA